MGDGIVGRFIKQVCRSTRIDKYKDELATNVNDARWRGAEGALDGEEVLRTVCSEWTTKV
jgi:hypothetical protein